MCGSGTAVWSAWDVNWPGCVCVHSYNRECVCKACVYIACAYARGEEGEWRRREKGGGLGGIENSITSTGQ